MGASWLEIESLLRQLDDVTSFPHSEALMPVARARDTVAEAAMLVSRAGVSGDRRAEADAQDAMARARVTLQEAQVAVRRAGEAVVASREGLHRADRLIREARALRARDVGRPVARPAAVATSIVSGIAPEVAAPGYASVTALVLRRG
jgi:hypothetical protein